MSSTTPVATLPQTGFVRLSLLVGDPKSGRPGILPFSASTVWRMVKSKTMPSPYRLSSRVTAWKAEDIREWLDAQSNEAEQ